MSRWILAYDGYDPAAEGRREALCTLGNGYFATRGAAPESSAGGVHYPGTYVAGCYDRLRAEVGGMHADNADLVNMPNWLPLTFRAEDGEWFDPDAASGEGRLLSYRQELDLRRGVLTRLVRVRDRAGRTFRLAQRRIVSMDEHVLGEPPADRRAATGDRLSRAAKGPAGRGRSASGTVTLALCRSPGAAGSMES